MPVVANLRAGLVEVFTLRGAERVVEAYGESRLDRIRQGKRESGERLRASRRLPNPADALSLLDEALRLALRALHEARSEPEPFDAPSELAWLGSSSADPLDPDALAAASALFAGETPDDFGARDLQRERVEAAVVRILRSVESRSPLELDALRIGRAAAVVLAITWTAGSWVHTHFMVHDVAAHKTVTASSFKQRPPEPSELVDGREHTAFNVHTNDGHPAWVMVDLSRTYFVRRVRVVNRGDGWFDDILPLQLQISLDNRTFTTVTTRTTHFDVWNVDLDGRPARYVRLARDNGYIALNKLEVFARE